LCLSLERILAKTSLAVIPEACFARNPSFGTTLNTERPNQNPMETAPFSNDFIESLIQSYETRIQNIESVFCKSDALAQSSYTLLQDFTSSIKNYRTERDTINSLLQENLAKNVSMRKKDYNRMMNDILNRLDEKEQEAEKQFNQFIEEQKAMIQFLKKGVLEIKDHIQDNNRGRIKAFRQELDHISGELELKKELVIQIFCDYQQMHRQVIEKLKMLLAKGDQVFVRDVKEVHRNLLSEIIN
jgi:hypothetical protein